MKKSTAIVLISIFVCLLFSCSHGFLKDPRLYNTKKKTNNVIVVAPEPELQLTGGVDPFDDENVWYNDPNEGFPHTDFETMSLVGTYFNDDNVPVYAMESGEVWAIKDASKNEFIHAKAPNTSGQGYAISNVNWYQYRGKNPLYAADGSYNTTLQLTSNLKPKLSRFYFYRFTGDTLSPSLDNFLFAVDTYSKLMFAFAYPTKTENVFGNNVPKAWGPTDGSAFLGTNYQFYMYDPVGYVEKKDGKYTVVMYDWFKQNLTKGIYQPTLGGLDDKSQGTALTTVASKTSDGAGTSPFNNHTVDFFEENMKLLDGVLFQRREITENGTNGLVLYEYTVGNGGTTITRTAKSWNGLPTSTDLKTITYTVGKKTKEENGSATKGIVLLDDGSSFDFELADESRTIVLGNGEKASYGFNDLGPDFIERVKHGPEYESPDGSKKYTFQNEGKTLIFVDGNTTYNYTYIQPRNNEDRNCAVYGSNDAYLYYAGFELTEKDALIKASRTSGAFTDTFVWEMTHDAYIIHEAGGSFTESVQGKSFSYRKVNEDGYDLSLMTLSFTEDGATATLYETLWGSSETQTDIVTEKVANGSSKNEGIIGSESATLTIPERDLWTLCYDNQTFTLNYPDPSPSFVNRVKNNPVYVSDDGKTMYRFSNFGKTMRMTYTGGWLLGIGNFDYEYTFVKNVKSEDSTKSYAVYGSDDAGAYYAGFELSESDILIKASRTSGAWDDTFAWDMTYDARRKKDTGGIPSEEDLDYFYESIRGKAFATRNVENDVAGLELLTWTFNENCEGTLTKQLWHSTNVDEVTTLPAIVAVNKTSGTVLLENGIRYTFSLDEESGALLVNTSTGNSGTTSLTYDLNYDDKGPGFVNRVKGKTYKNGITVYKFSNDGKSLTLTYINWAGSTVTKTYQYEAGKDNLTDISTRYGGYRVRLYDEENLIRISTVANVSDSVSVMEWPAYRQVTLTQKESFSSTVAGTSFKLRSVSEPSVYDLDLEILTFSDDGKKVIFKKDNWYSGSHSEQGYDVSNGSSYNNATLGGLGSVTLDISNPSAPKLTVNGKTYEANYTDPTPSFINRVKNRWYQGQYLDYQPHNYVFSADGKTMYYIYKGSTKTYSWTGKPTDTTNTTFNEWKYPIDITDTEEGKAYEFDYAGVDYDATYKGTAEAAKNAGLSFP